MNLFAQLDKNICTALVFLTPEDLDERAKLGQQYVPAEPWFEVGRDVDETRAEWDLRAKAEASAALERGLQAVVQRELDRVAQSRGYDSIFTATTYAEEASVPVFQAEGRALRAWRSKVWALCYSLLAEVQAGQRPAPTADELLALLPAPGLP